MICTVKTPGYTGSFVLAANNRHEAFKEVLALFNWEENVITFFNPNEGQVIILKDAIDVLIISDPQQGAH